MQSEVIIEDTNRYSKVLGGIYLKFVDKNELEIKSYLMSDYGDSKYKRHSLIEIYVKDIKYYDALVKKHLVKEEAVLFFKKKDVDLRTASVISINAFRKLKYELIIDNYLIETEKDTKIDVKDDFKKKSGESVDKKKDIPKEIAINEIKTKTSKGITQQLSKSNSKEPEKLLHCPYCKTILDKQGIKKASNAVQSLLFPIYKCASCKRDYTSLNQYKNMITIRIGEKRYLNLNLVNNIGPARKVAITKKKSEKSFHKMLPKSNICYVYGVKKPVVCKNPECKRKLEEVHITFNTQKGKKQKRQVKRCSKCGAYYLSMATYFIRQDIFQCLNIDEFLKIQEELRIEKEEKRKRKEEKEKRKEEAERIRKEKMADDAKEREKLRQKKLEERHLAERKAQEEREKKKLMIYKAQKVTQKDIIHQNDNTIRVKDFVVRRTTFKCMNQNHKLKNIDGLIGVINKNGDIQQFKISAGYCANCNTFFIMESTYQNLKMKGTPICRISDEKAYLKNNVLVNGMHLAQESILMQYGYTVSQGEGLSDARRRKILAVLVDNEILTRSDIIGYLDFFINQRQYQHKYEKAIAKWESDREFISGYKSGSYTQYGVRGIYRQY